MATIEPEDVYSAAKKILPYLEPELQAEVQALLTRAESGEKTDNKLLEIMAGNSEARAWMKKALFDEAGLRDATLPGGVGSISVGSKWVCPISDCGFGWEVRKIGQPVPPCPVHQTALVREP